MKHWDARFIEIRNVHQGIFNSPINTPALMGDVLDDKENIITTYELEILKQPCAVLPHIDPRTFEETKSMCFVFEYRTKDPSGLLGDHQTTGHLPKSEVTPELLEILRQEELI